MTAWDYFTGYLAFMAIIASIVIPIRLLFWYFEPPDAD